MARRQPPYTEALIDQDLRLWRKITRKISAQIAHFAHSCVAGHRDPCFTMAMRQLPPLDRRPQYSEIVAFGATRAMRARLRDAAEVERVPVSALIRRIIDAALGAPARAGQH